MKAKLLFVFVVLAAIVYFLPIPVTQTETIGIHAHYDKVLGKINNLKAWNTWWPDPAGNKLIGDTVLQTPVITYTLKERQPLSVTLTENTPHVRHVISVVPAAGDTVTTVTWKKTSYLRTALPQMLGLSSGNGAYRIANLLQKLQSHLEDPLQYYGFDISIKPVEDTFILVMRAGCSKADIPQCLRKMFTVLQQQLDAAHYQGKAERMFYVDSSAIDPAAIMAGISIARALPVQAPYQIMKMPRAHIVVGLYEGDYRHIGRLHDAMSQYMKEKKIGIAAVPYEKLLSDPQSAGDSLHVKIKVYQPAMLY